MGGESISPRTGRPKIDNPKSVDIKVRIDKCTNARLVKKCMENKITRAEAIRKAIIDYLGK